MSPKKSERATVARLTQTGYSTDSDFFFGSNPHFQAIVTQCSLLTFETVCALLYVSLHCFILLTRATNLFKD